MDAQERAIVFCGYVGGALAGHMKAEAEPNWPVLSKQFENDIRQAEQAAAAKAEKEQARVLCGEASSRPREGVGGGRDGRL